MPTIKFEIKVLFFIFYSAWPTARSNDITNREKTEKAESLATFATSFPLTAVYFDSPGIMVCQKRCC